MAQIAAPTLILMNQSLLTIGGTNSYELSVSKAELAPTTPTSRFKGIGGSTVVAAGTPTWVLGVDWAQDWQTTNSLSDFCFVNQGTVQLFLLEPQADEDGWSGTILVTASNIGGAVDAPATSSMSFEVIGQPTRIPAV